MLLFYLPVALLAAQTRRDDHKGLKDGNIGDDLSLAVLIIQGLFLFYLMLLLFRRRVHIRWHPKCQQRVGTLVYEMSKYKFAESYYLFDTFHKVAIIALITAVPNQGNIRVIFLLFIQVVSMVGSIVGNPYKNYLHMRINSFNEMFVIIGSIIMIAI